jgi:hypothetical protein
LDKQIIYTQPTHSGAASQVQIPASSLMPVPKRIPVGWSPEEENRKTAQLQPHKDLPSPKPIPIQLPAFRKQELAQSRAIAQRVQDDSRSQKLELMLRRQYAKSLNPFTNSVGERSSQPLEHLAIGETSDHRYAIINPRTAKPLSRQTFETSTLCVEAASLLERTFSMEHYLDTPATETSEQVEEIIRYYCWKEMVRLKVTPASPASRQTSDSTTALPSL